MILRRLTAAALALFASVLVAVAQEEPPERDIDFVAGRAALEDGFYDVAAARLEKFVDSTIVKRKKANAAIFLFRAWYGVGASDKITAWLERNWSLATGTRYESGFYYWYAQAKYAQGDYRAAIEYIEDFDKDFPGDEFAPYALRLHALALRDDGQLAKAEALFARYDAQYADRKEVADNLLDWAGVLIQMNRVPDAEVKLKTLVEKLPASAPARNARLWLGQAAVERDQYGEAETWLKTLAVDPDAEASLRAGAWFALARSAVDQGLMTNALSALAQGEQFATNAERRVEARIDQARLLMQLGRLNEAVQIMDETVFTLASEPQAARAQLELSDLLRAQGQFEKAAAAYQRYIESFTDVAGQRHALLSKAWCLWELKRYGEAALAFEKAYNALRNNALREQALVKAADAYFKNAQYRLAAETYEKALSEFPQSGGTAETMYQAAESYARAGDPTNTVAALQRVIDAAPSARLALASSLRLARFFDEQKESDRAAAAYDEFIRRYDDPALVPQALLERGMLRYRQGRYQEALEDFERLLADYAASTYAERAFFMRGWCEYQLGNTDTAVSIGNQFLTAYTNSEWRADVAFWLAEHDFNAGLYGQAETNFLAMVAAYPASLLADDGLYWSGRSAAEQKAYRRAIDVYTQLARQYTNSPLIPEARFAQGDALTEIGDFAGAILAFQEIVNQYPASPLVARALGRIGDCQFTLGSDRPDRYQDAIAAFRAAMTHPAASRNLALQSEYKLARANERVGRLEDALTHYLNVVYGWLAARTEGVPADEIWFVRAAFSAAELKESQLAWDDAITIYQRVIDSGVTAGADARIRIERIASQRQRGPAAPAAPATRSARGSGTI